MNENKRIKQIFRALRPYVNGELVTSVFKKYFDELEELVSEREIWIAEYWNIDVYARMGFFDTQFKAFIACLEDYKERNEGMMSYYKNGKFDKNDKRHVYDLIKDLRRYDIHQIKVQ